MDWFLVSGTICKISNEPEKGTRLTLCFLCVLYTGDFGNKVFKVRSVEEVYTRLYVIVTDLCKEIEIVKK